MDRWQLSDGLESVLLEGDLVREPPQGGNSTIIDGISTYVDGSFTWTDAIESGTGKALPPHDVHHKTTPPVPFPFRNDALRLIKDAHTQRNSTAERSGRKHRKRRRESAERSMKTKRVRRVSGCKTEILKSECTPKQETEITFMCTTSIDSSVPIVPASKVTATSSITPYSQTHTQTLTPRHPSPNPNFQTQTPTPNPRNPLPYIFSDDPREDKRSYENRGTSQATSSGQNKKCVRQTRWGPALQGKPSQQVIATGSRYIPRLSRYIHHLSSSFYFLSRWFHRLSRYIHRLSR
jgi:hypothetical protein